MAIQHKNLIEQIKAGNVEAEDKILNLLRPTVFEIVRSRIENYVEVQDLIQDILLAALLKLREGAYDWNRASLDKWVAGITWNKLKDYWKKLKIVIPMKDVPDNPVNPDHQENLEREEKIERLRNELKNLPEKYHEVLYMRFFQGLEVREISTKISLPPRRVAERLHYARKLLRNKFTEEEIISMLRGVLLIIKWGPICRIS